MSPNFDFTDLGGTNS